MQTQNHNNATLFLWNVLALLENLPIITESNELTILAIVTTKRHEFANTSNNAAVSSTENAVI